MRSPLIIAEVSRPRRLSIAEVSDRGKLRPGGSGGARVRRGPAGSAIIKTVLFKEMAG